jgi:hypothetical protein
VGENPIEIQLAEDTLALVKKKMKWAAAKEILRPISNAMMLIGIETRLDSTHFNVVFSGDKELLTKAVRILRVAGFSFDPSDRPKAGETSWSTYFRHPDCQINIWFYFTSTVCKQVQVGTKTVEVPVYEVQCGETIGQLEISDGDTTPRIEPPQPQLEDDIPF